MALDPKSDIIKFVPRRITINFIPHNDQRYNTVGDYFQSGQITETIINVSEMDPRLERLVAIHELIEMTLCNDAAISIKEIDAYDMGPGKDSDEPGFDTACPYRIQHAIATSVEMMLAAMMNINWLDYEKYLEKLTEGYKK